MSMIIKDGTGTGKVAKVSNNNHLATDAVTVDEITHISAVEGGAHSVHLKRTLLAADTLENVGHITYTGEYQLQVQTVGMSREDVTLTSGGQAYFDLLTGATYTSGGAAIDAVNLNLGSSKELGATIYTGTTTLVVDTTLSQDLYDIVVRDHEDIEFNGSLIMNKGDTLTIQTRSKNIGDTVYVVLTCFEVTELI
jgi:hypothetical protein